ncbi:unnamed protein product [Polarella glacialis]|uniref:Uncharacterized protein n=1 Tax=Polarella glacialis TaxID=89957 RepID=A0A813GRH7_POLGL|nr:unnamed protein product [Polarella glacialis]
MFRLLISMRLLSLLLPYCDLLSATAAVGTPDPLEASCAEDSPLSLMQRGAQGFGLQHHGRHAAASAATSATASPAYAASAASAATTDDLDWRAFKPPVVTPVKSQDAAAAQLVGASKNATSANSTVEPRKPRIYFLFLAAHRVYNFEIWKAFFATAPAEKYRAFIHCVEEDCKQSVVGSTIQVVPTVPTVYCIDLVTAQQQLIRYALKDKDGAPNPDDKFAFVSDSTLPAKPFSEIYGTLAPRHSSDFCVSPVGEWKEGTKPSNVMIKHHEWVVAPRKPTKSFPRRRLTS